MIIPSFGPPTDVSYILFRFPFIRKEKKTFKKTNYLSLCTIITLGVYNLSPMVYFQLLRPILTLI